MKLTAAIPNYNGLPNLKLLLPRLIEQEFDTVYLLDDASTDDSVVYVRQNFPSINVIAGTTNLGPGGNRNRIIEHEQDGIILFVDADIELPQQDIRATIETKFQDEEIGAIGWLIYTKENRPMWWNYGYEMNPLREAAAYTIEKMLSLNLSPEQKLQLQILARPYTHNLDIEWSEPTERETDWVAEGFFAIKAKSFSAIGGFDTNFRYHEGQDLFKRIREACHEKVLFSPVLYAKHLEIEVRKEKRGTDKLESKFYFFQKHWGMSRDIFNQIYDISPSGSEH